MNATVQSVQRRLIALSYPLPKFGADGDLGGETFVALNAALDDLATVKTAQPPAVAAPPVSAGPRSAAIPAAWMPEAKVSRIIFHWTAGQNKASQLDREHYHILIEGDGKLVRGVPSIALNSEPKAKAGYAAHTLNCNTGSIGVSLCGMALATESPFNPGKQPITRVQWEKLAVVLAELCARYSIPVSREAVLSHAEVQTTLKIIQKGKWDIARLPFDTSIQGGIKIGDQMRAMVKSRL